MTQQRVSPISVTSVLPATVTLSVQGALGQSVNLTEWKSSTGSILALVSSGGSITWGPTFTSFLSGVNGRAEIQPNAATIVPLVAKGFASQTADLQQWQNSAGTVLARIASNGDFLSTVTIGAPYFSDGTATRPYIDFTVANKMIAQARNAAYVAWTVRGAASQTANLQEWQNSAGTVLAFIASDGTPVTAAGVGLKVGGTGITGHFTVTVPSATTIPAVIRGAASQTANLQEWQNSAGTIKSYINSSGTIVSLTSSNIFIGDAAANVVFRVRGAASQSANLQEWQDSASAVLASLASDGTFTVPVVRTTNILATLTEENSGGRLRLTKMSSSASAPGTDLLKLYVVAGTNAGTLKLVVRAGSAGAETTILDNIPQT